MFVLISSCISPALALWKYSVKSPISGGLVLISGKEVSGWGAQGIL